MLKNNRLAVDGVNLAYEDYGSGKPVVFIHGFPTSSFSWSRVARPLAEEGYRCISFDMMGFGESDMPLDQSYGIPNQARLIRRAIEKLGLERPVIVGHSMGGAICLHMLMDLEKRPDAVSAIVLANAACYPQPMPWFFLALKIPILPKLVLRWIPPWIAYLMVKDTAYCRTSGMETKDIYDYVMNVRKPGAAEAFIATAREIVPPDIDEMVAFYPRIDVPALVIWGKRDWIIPLRYGERLASEIPNAQLCVVEDCRHTPQEERPEETLRAMIPFMKSLGY